MRDFSVWQQCFVAALTGSAVDPWPVTQVEQDVINRAVLVADAAEEAIEARWQLHIQTRNKPPPTPSPSKAWEETTAETTAEWKR